VLVLVLVLCLRVMCVQLMKGIILCNLLLVALVALVAAVAVVTGLLWLRW
jgi:hypothetical protein